MMGLSDGERISMIRSAVLIQYTRVTDGWTELAWHIRAIAYMLSRVLQEAQLLLRDRATFVSFKNVVILSSE